MNIQKILANIVVVVGFVVVPFIPFLVFGGSTFFPFIVGKNFAFRVVVEIMLAGWIVLAVIDPVYRPRKSVLLWVLGAFIGIITLSALLGENPAKSFWSNFERMEGVITYFHLFAYFVVASTVLTARKMWRPYLNLHLGAGVIMAIYGVLQWAGDFTIVQDGIRVNGTLGNAAYLGTYALFNIFIALFLMARESMTTIGEKARIAIYSVIILLQIFVLYHTATRGAVLGLMVGIGITTILVAVFARERVVLRRTAIGILVALALFVGGFIAIRNATFIQQSPVLSRFSSISFAEQTTKSRFMVWGMAYQGFKEHPVLGWGMENFNYVFNKYYNPKMFGQEQWFDRAHNVFFDWLIAGGIPALLIYLSIFGCAAYCIWRRATSLSVVEKSVLTGLLGGYFFQNLFVFDNITSLIYFVTILAYIEGLHQIESMPRESEAILRGRKLKAENRKNAEEAEDFTSVVSGGAIIFAFILIYIVNYNGYKQNTVLLRAVSERGEQGLEHNLSLFKEALAYDSYGTAEVREQLGQLSMNGFDSSKGISETQGKFISLAVSELALQAKELPNDARYQVFAGSLLSRIGHFDEALPYLIKARELSPSKQTILFELGSAYYNKKDFTKAEEVFKMAYELAPEYGDAKKFYISILKVNGNNEELAKVLHGE
ncbi:MAG: O-antigen ligase family protein [Candidatus Yonathbacteria bacterium]|nr:O-antigen ligase family protein [Candidatus Yonathbacteria bacterium]